jgi:hypothetical protein
MNETGMQNMSGNIIFYTLGRGGGTVGVTHLRNVMKKNVNFFTTVLSVIHI